jgi:hypothetical protein
MMRRIGPRGLAAVIVALIALTSCGGDDPGPSGDAATGTAATRPSTDATLSIRSPTNGEIVHGDTVNLAVQLHGATLVPATSNDLRPDEGHLHVLLDDQLISMTSGLMQKVTDLTPGQHVIKVEFVANDHAPFDPRVIAGVAFEVRP